MCFAFMSLPKQAGDDELRREKNFTQLEASISRECVDEAGAMVFRLKAHNI